MVFWILQKVNALPVFALSVKTAFVEKYNTKLYVKTTI